MFLAHISVHLLNLVTFRSVLGIPEIQDGGLKMATIWQT